MSEGATAIGAVESSVSQAVDTTLDTQQAVDTSTSATQTADDGQQVDAADKTVQTGEVDLSGPIKKAIETLKASDPQAARALRDLYHQQEAFKKEFPGGLKEVQALKTTFEEIGGSEGIQAIQAERQEWQDTDSKLAAGDASVLDRIIKLSPEGFTKLVPGALDKLAATDRDVYNHTLAGPFVATLDSWQLPATLDTLIENLSQVVGENNQPLLAREVQALQKLAAQVKGVKDLANKVPTKSVDPERQKLEEDRKQFQQEKQSAFRKEVDAETQKYAAAKYDALIAEESKAGIGIPEKGTRSYANMLKEIDGEMAREMAKRPGLLQKLNSYDATGKKQELVTYLNSEFEKVAPKVVQRVAKEWMSPNKTAIPAKKQVASTNTGTTKLKEPPTPDQIDWSKTKREDTMNGRAYLKGRTGLHTWLD